MKKEEIRAHIFHLLRENFHVSADNKFFDLSEKEQNEANLSEQFYLDSIDEIMFIIDLERDFGITVIEPITAESLGFIIDYIEERTRKISLTESIEKRQKKTPFA